MLQLAKLVPHTFLCKEKTQLQFSFLYSKYFNMFGCSINNGVLKVFNLTPVYVYLLVKG